MAQRFPVVLVIVEGCVTAALVPHKVSNSAAMSHPHIVRFLGAFMQGGEHPALCILLEYAAGGTLHEDIRRQRKARRSYDSNVVISWATQLATAVSYMHGRNVLHRDLSSGVPCALDVGNLVNRDCRSCKHSLEAQVYWFWLYSL